MIEREKIDIHIESLINLEFTVEEIKNSLIKNTDLTNIEISEKINELNKRSLPAYYKVIKRFLIIALIFGAITLVLTLLYKYNNNQYEKHLQNLIETKNAISIGNGKYLVEGGDKWFDIFGTMAGWTALAGAISFLYSGIYFFKRLRLKMLIK
jgi:hypothetical protein